MTDTKVCNQWYSLFRKKKKVNRLIDRAQDKAAPCHDPLLWSGIVTDTDAPTLNNFARDDVIIRLLCKSLMFESENTFLTKRPFYCHHTVPSTIGKLYSNIFSLSFVIGSQHFQQWFLCSLGDWWRLNRLHLDFRLRAVTVDSEGFSPPTRCTCSSNWRPNA